MIMGHAESLFYIITESRTTETGLEQILEQLISKKNEQGSSFLIISTREKSPV